MEALARWYKVVAVVNGVAAACAAQTGLKILESNPGVGWGLVVGSAAWGLLSVITALAFAQGLWLIIDMEATLREIRDRLPPTRSS
jgi:uncharacterized membrane protein (DUF441 family)